MSITSGTSALIDSIRQFAHSSENRTAILIDQHTISYRTLLDRLLRWSELLQECEAVGVLVASHDPVVRLELQIAALAIDSSFCSIKPGYSYATVREVCINSGLNLVFLDSKNYLTGEPSGEWIDTDPQLYLGRFYFDPLFESKSQAAKGAVIVEDWSNSQSDFLIVDKRHIEDNVAFFASNYLGDSRQLNINGMEDGSLAELLVIQLASLMAGRTITPASHDSFEIVSEKSQGASKARPVDKVWIIPAMGLPFAVSRHGTQILRPLPGCVFQTSSTGHLYLQLHGDALPGERAARDVRLLDTGLRGWLDAEGRAVIE